MRGTPFGGGLVRRRFVWPLVAVGAVMAVLLGGCGPITSMYDTQQALRDAGYQSVSVSFNYRNADEVKVSVTVNAAPSATNANDVAGIVWQKFHERFSLLALTVHGSGPALTRDYSYADLVSLFGPRNPAYDRTSLSSATNRLGVIAIIVVVVLIAAVVFIVVMVTRRRRRRRPPSWPAGGPPWMQGGPPWMQGGPQWMQGGPPPGGGPWQPGAPWQPGPGQPVAPWHPGLSGGTQPPAPSGAPWQPGGPPPPQGGSQPPANFPLWPPPQGPPPGRPTAPAPPCEPQPRQDDPAGEQATVWPPAPSPPAGRD
ncbi:MAG TPA: hypothetical protein VMO88_03425 [Acidimicrobiales bacterium]|nr:hypothetical protein [Acidimicrobiales bacterium]